MYIRYRFGGVAYIIIIIISATMISQTCDFFTDLFNVCH